MGREPENSRLPCGMGPSSASVPAVVDYVNRKRDVSRKHGIGYLLRLTPPGS